MTQCHVIEFRDGKPATYHKLHNAWGGAAFIWSSLFDKYLRDPRKEYDTWLGSATKANAPLWKLAERTDLPLHQRAVHIATFDNVIVEREHFARMAADLRSFAKDFPGPSHLEAWAKIFDVSTAEAIGFWQTSVCSDPWSTYNQSTDEEVPYDLNTGDKHYEVYDHLESLAASVEA